jgi:hypothetical protein
MSDSNYAQAVLDRLNAASPGLEPDLALYRNVTNPAHRSLIPFDELDAEVQELDREYMNAIHEAAQA